MALSKDMTFNDWVIIAGGLISQVLVAEDRMLHVYKKWYDFQYGKSDADIATLWSAGGGATITAADVAKFKTLMEAVKDSYGFWHGDAVAQRDRELDVSPFISM